MSVYKQSGPSTRVPTEGNTQKDPHDWVTGNEPATGAQQSYLHTLAAETGETVPDDLTKAEASETIDALRRKDPRLKSAQA